MEHYQEVMVALSDSVKKISRKRPPSVEITMTSNSACNETSLFWKPCILDQMLVRNAIRK